MKKIMLTPDKMEEFGIQKLFQHLPELLTSFPKIGLSEYICVTQLGTYFCIDPDGYMHPENGDTLKELAYQLCISKTECLPVGNEKRILGFTTLVGLN